MRDFLDNVYGTLFKPGETLRNITQRQLVGQSLIILILSGLLPALARTGQTVSDLNMLMPHGAMRTMPHEVYSALGRMAPFFGFIAVIFSVVFRPLKQFLYAALFHLISGFAGGNGTARGLFAGLGFASLPAVFAAPVNVTTRLSGINFTTPFNFLLFIWVVFLEVLAIRENNDFTTSKAVLVLVLPWVVVFGLIIFMAMVMAGTIMPFIMPYINDMM
jgi:hypothetical protein